MEKSQKWILGGLGVAAALVITGLLGGFSKILNSEADSIRNAATMASPVGNAVPTSTPTPATYEDKDPQPAGPQTSIKYEEESYDFGLIKEGEHAVHIFKFKNTGTEPLVISNARGSCGCTVPTWPKDAILPGATGEIKVDFDSNGKPGNQSKRITVVANTNPSETFLTIQGIVRGKDQQPSTTKGH